MTLYWALGKCALSNSRVSEYLQDEGLCGVFPLRSGGEHYSVQPLNGQCMPCGSLPATFNDWQRGASSQVEHLTLWLVFIVSVRNPLSGLKEKTNMSEERQFEALRLLEANSKMTQRELAQALGVSLGATNYCLKALIDKGWLKLENFQRSPNKLGYLYLLTPKGVAAKAQLTARFLQRKLVEYESLRVEIEALRCDIEDSA